MIRNFGFFLLLILLSCNSNEVKPTSDDDYELEQAFDLMLEGTNFTDLCGIVYIDSTKINSYHIYFDRNACTGTLKRNGEMIVTLTQGNNWNEKNAQMGISYLNYVIENQSNQPKSTFFSKQTLTGTQLITNVSGGTMEDFLDHKTDYLKRKTRGQNLVVKYNNNPNPYRYNETWVNEIRWGENNVAKHITRGDTVINNYDNVQEWGIDTYNQRVHKVIAEPLVKTLCNKRWVFTEGTKTIYGMDQYGNSIIKRKIFGVDKNGNADGTCTCYGFKEISEKSNGEIIDRIYKY